MENGTKTNIVIVLLGIVIVWLLFLTFKGTNNTVTTLKEMGIRLADNTIQYQSNDGSWSDIAPKPGKDGREIELR